MDWNLAVTVFGAALTAVGMGGAAIVGVTRYYIDSKVQAAVDLRRQEAMQEREKFAETLHEHIEILLDAKLSAQSADILTRVNGAYMRGPEQRAINDNFTRQMGEFTDELKEIRGVLNKMHGDMAIMTASVGKAWVASSRAGQ